MSTNALARPISSRRSFLGVATAALAGTASIATASSAPATDPAFAEIEASKAAWRAYGKALQVQDDPATAEEEAIPQTVADALAQDAAELWDETERAAFKVVPTTTAGLFALLELWWHANVLDYGHHPEGGEHEAERLEDREVQQLQSLLTGGRAFLAGSPAGREA